MFTEELAECKTPREREEGWVGRLLRSTLLASLFARALGGIWPELRPPSQRPSPHLYLMAALPSLDLLPLSKTPVQIFRLWCLPVPRPTVDRFVAEGLISSDEIDWLRSNVFRRMGVLTIVSGPLHHSCK